MAKQQDDWGLVGNTDAWKPENEGDEISGIYISKDENVGSNNSNMYYLEQADGEVIGVWGSAVVDSRMGKVQPGMEVKIIYKGKIKTKNNREAKNFEVYARKTAFKPVDVDPSDVI